MAQHWLANVLEPTRSKGNKAYFQFVLDLLIDRIGNDDSAWLCQGLQACGDIDAVAIEQAIFFHHVAEVDSDAQSQALIWWKWLILPLDCSLYCLSTMHRIHRTGEMRHQTVTNTPEFDAVMFSRQTLEEHASFT